MTTTFLLCDDHPMILDGLRRLIASRPGWKVVGEAGDGSTALELLARFTPDVAVIDLSLPVVPGMEVITQGRSWSPDTAFVVLSMHTDLEYAVAAFARGAAAYVTKETSSTALVEAVQHVLAGRKFVSAPLELDEVHAGLADPARAVVDPLAELTARERQIFFLTASGATAEQIADELGISPRTVSVHRAHVYAKLGLSGQPEVIALAYQEGLLTAAEPRT